MLDKITIEIIHFGDRDVIYVFDSETAANAHALYQRLEAKKAEIREIGY